MAYAIGALFLFALIRSCVNSADTGSGTPDAASGTTATATATSSPSPRPAFACPGRIAAELPSGRGAELVAAYRTDNKQITLCRTRGGALYYFGEFSDQREPGIAMPARQTGDGYEASNPPYTYRVHDDVVTVYKSGTQISTETLTPEPSPS
ncbi:hypothetical protein ACU686_31825 [Yinghuangia aomiensis]